nr:hypothetical protein [Streptacidiphilus rugosus]
MGRPSVFPEGSRGYPFAGVLRDHVPLELQHSGEHRDEQLRHRVVGREVHPSPGPGGDPQVEAAALEEGPDVEDVAHRAEKPRGVGKPDRVADGSRVQQLEEAGALERVEATGRRWILERGGAAREVGGEGVPLAGVGLLDGRVTQV